MRRITIESDGRESEHVVRKLQFSADGRILSGLLGGEGECPTVFRYDLEADHELELPATDDDWEVGREEAQIDPCVSRDGEMIVEVLRRESGYRGLRIMDVWAKPVGVSWIMHDDASPLPTAMTFSNDCETLWTVGVQLENGPETLAAWAVQDLIELHQPIPSTVLSVEVGKNKSETCAIALHPTERMLLRAAVDRRVELVHLVERESPIELCPAVTQFGDFDPTLLFAPNGSTVLVVDEFTTKLWTLDGRLFASIPVDAGTAVTFSPDSRSILSAHYNGDIVTRTVADGREVARLNFGLGPVTGLAFAPEGLTAAAGLTDGTIVIWDV